MQLSTTGRLVSMVAAVVIAGACGGSGGTEPTGGGPDGPGPGGSTSNAITVANNRFTPAATTVPAGTTVTWTWDSCTSDGYGGTSCVEHDVVFDDAQQSATQDGGSWSRSFPTAGTYAYHCSRHGSASSGMRGTVTVQ
jgi:plastocyanin